MSKTVHYEYKYRYGFYPDWSSNPQPIVPVELKYGRNEVWAGDAIVDSGADYPYFDLTIASDWFELDITKLAHSRMKTPSGGLSVYRQKLGIKFGPLRTFMECEICFVDGFATSHAPNLL